MKIRFLLEIDFKSSYPSALDAVPQAARIVAGMINKEFQDPSKGVLLHIKSIKEAPQVVMDLPQGRIVQAPPGVRPEIVHEVLSPARIRKRRFINERRVRIGLRPLYDPITGRRLNNG